jgi:von Willebrand factor type A domain
MKILEKIMRSATLGLFAVAAGASAVACQSYNMEGVDPQTLVAVETTGTFTAGKAPALLIVQDRSGSMEMDFGGSSRMDVAQRVMSSTVGGHRGEVLFGLVLYGVGDNECGDPAEITAPGLDTVDTVLNAYESHPAILTPAGGTPTTAALRAAYDSLVDPATGKVAMTDRENYVVLVTDGLMNCNVEHAMPCVCANETGCTDSDGNRNAVAFGEEGMLLDGRFCLDDSESIDAVLQLRQAGVKTFVIGLGESFTGGGTSDIGVVSLNALAEAGGVARAGTEKFYSAADETELEDALDEIIDSIVVPCEYALDGPVCDGRLLSIEMKIDGETVPTVCGEGDDAWQFAPRGDGSLDPQRILFSENLCNRLTAAESVEISIKGVESGCESGEDGTVIGPACDLRTP